MPAARTSESSTPIEERIAWYALLAMPLLVPLVVGIVPFSHAPAFAQNPFIYPKILVLALLVLATATSWGIGIARGTIRPRRTPGLWWLSGFLGLAAVSTAFAMNRTMAFFGGKYQRVGLLVLLLAAAAFYLAVQLLSSQSRMRAFAWSTVSAGVIASLVTILQSMDRDPLGMSRENLYVLHRGPSLLGNPDFTATYLVVPVVVAAALVLSSPTLRSRLIAAACFGVTLLGVAVSLTRGAWVGVAVALGALAVAALRSPAARKTVAVLGAGLLLVTLVAVGVRGPASFVARFADLSSATTAGDSRFVLWGEALSVVRDHPLTGTGPDSYVLGWYSARSRTSMRLTGVATANDDPHNIVLLAAATLGVPAALVAVAMFVLSLVAAAPAAFSRGATAPRLLYSGWWAALVGLLVALVFGPNVVVVTLTAALAAAVLAAPRATTVEASRLTIGLALTLSALALAFLVLASLSYSADVRLASSRAKGDIAGMDAATRIAPWHLEARYLVAYAYATEAVAQLVQGSPGAESAVATAENRLYDLTAADPHDYASQVLFARFLAQCGSVQGAATLERALAAADKAIALYPLSPVASYLKALTLVDLGRPKDALATLEPVWDVDPAYGDAGTLYAQVLVAQGERKRAEQVLDALRGRFWSTPGFQEVEASLEATSTGQ